MLWTISPDGTITPTPLPNQVGGYGGSNNYAGGISSNGRWICGASTAVTGEFQAEGTIWDVEDLAIPIGAGPGSTPTFSELYRVSDDGTAIGFDGLLPLVKPAQGPAFYLPVDPTESFGFGTGITADGSMMVGFYNTAAARIPRVWLDGGSSFYDLDDPWGIYAEAGNISPDGSRISGTIIESGGTNLFACGWNDKGLVLIPDLEGDEPLYGVSYAVSNDGMWVGVGSDAFGSFAFGFVWHESWPAARRFTEWVVDATGVAIDDEIYEVWSVFNDGERYHFTVRSYPPLGDPDEGVDYVSMSVVAPPCPADVAAPFGLLDLADVTAFAAAFLAGESLADLAPPFGLLDLADVNGFVASFLAGCPG